MGIRLYCAHDGEHELTHHELGALLQHNIAPEYVLGFRSIGTSDSLENVFFMISTNRLYMIHDEETARLTLTEWSADWNKGRRPEEAPWFLQHIINPDKKRGNHSFCVSLDIRKAFDRFDWGAVKKMAAALRLNEQVIMTMLTEEAKPNMVIYIEDGVRPDPIKRFRGGSQGRPELSLICNMPTGWLIKDSADIWLRVYCNNTLHVSCWPHESHMLGNHIRRQFLVGEHLSHGDATNDPGW